MSKIILGTANFMQPYGALSQGSPVSFEEISQIMNVAEKRGIQSLDTALAYGDIFSVIPKEQLKKFHIITKISVLENPAHVIARLNELSSHYPYEAILIHDPANIRNVSKEHVQELINVLKGEFGHTRMGISVYDEEQVIDFCQHAVPDVIQIPLNPFNQSMNSETFRTLVEHNNIEVHGRSLFLQGILLLSVLPDFLRELQGHFDDFNQNIPNGITKLNALLKWALLEMSWVDSWVLGVASSDHLIKILDEVDEILSSKQKIRPLNFQPLYHPLVDPRNWENAA